MTSAVREHIAELIDLCRVSGVSRLELFGSAATGAFDPQRSDMDLIAWFDDKGPGYVDRFLRFAEDAETILGRRADVITPRSIANHERFRQSIDASRLVIYDERLADKAT